MPDLTQLVHVALKGLPSKPEDTATREAKKRYSELMSEALAPAFAEALRARGMTDIRPAGPGEVDAGGGGQLPLAGGLGAKTIDLSWASEQSGLIFAMSIKAISFKDGRSKNFQKNLANRSETMLFEAVTLHKRFPSPSLSACSSWTLAWRRTARLAGGPPSTTRALACDCSPAEQIRLAVMSSSNACTSSS